MTEGRLADRRVLVAGGTGEVGEGVVRRLLAAGAEAVVPARRPEAGALLRSRLSDHERLTIVEAPFSTIPQALALANAVLAGGRLDAVVASVGGWWRGGRLAEIDPDAWDSVVASNLTPHVALARAFLDRLPPGGAFVQILGGAAERPAPGSSLVSIVSAAVAMLGRVLAAERPNGAAAVHQLQIDSPVVTRSRPQGRPSWVTADAVGDAVVELIAGRTVAGDIRIHLPARP